MKFVDLDSEIEETGTSKNISKKTERASDYNLKTNASFLSSVSKTKLQYYLSKSPQLKVIEQQINILKNEFGRYKKANDVDNMDKTQELIVTLQSSKNKFTKQFKEKNYSKDKEKNIKNVKDSQIISDLKSELKEFEHQFKMYNPLSLINKITYYRKDLKLGDVQYDFDDTIQDIDDILDDDTNISELEYQNLCAHIGDIIGEYPKVVAEMSTNKILQALKELSPDMSDVKGKIENLKFEISSEINKINGTEDITNIIFDTFDFETADEELPKEMLAAANIDLVNAIAFNKCNSTGMLHFLDDARAYGLLGLSLAINKWYGIQKMKDSAVSFNGFANIYITNTIKRGMYDLTSGGRLNPSAIATLQSKRNKQIGAFKQNNPELKDLPTEFVDILLDAEEFTEVPGNIVTEGSFKATVTGDDSNNNDAWSNALFDSDNDDKFMNAKFEHENLLKSIKTLFSMFETKETKDGLLSKSNKKLFDRFDYKLFKMLFGIEYSPIDGHSYSQSEIAELLTEYAQSLGHKSKTFSQSAISTRTQNMIDKIRSMIEIYPEIKLGFEYFWNYSQTKIDLPEEVAELNSNINQDIIQQLQDGNSFEYSID